MRSVTNAIQVLEAVAEGVVSVGAAIRPGHGRPIASLSIPGPASRTAPGLLTAYGKNARQAAEAIGAALPVSGLT
jgi:DNA-binding IclR family transcriptional regulator